MTSGGRAPLSLQQLADMADNSLVWDPHQPILRYVGAVRQLVQESRVYHREGDYDRAFVFCCKIDKLTTELLPHRHPDYNSLPPLAKEQLRKDSDAVGGLMTSLKMAIIRRNEDWEKGGSPTSITSPLPPPTTTSPALTLKNTVQPSTHSMTSTASPSASSKEAEALVKYAAAAASKTSRTAKFKKAFGVGKKGKSAGAMVEPGTAIEEEDGKEEKDWTMISGGRHAGPGPEVSVSRPSRDQPRDQLLRQQASYEHPRRSQEHLPVRRSTNSTSSSAGKMPMPGEDESDDELQGIAYSPAPGYGQQWQTGRPPSIASSNSQAPSPIAYHPPLPSAPTWSPPIDVYAHLQNTLQHPPSQSYAAPSNQPSYPAYPTPQQRPGPNKLQRTPSRLTTSHQQQQGYAPSAIIPNAVAPLAPPPLLAAPSYSPGPSAAQFAYPHHQPPPPPSQPQYAIPPPQGRYPSSSSSSPYSSAPPSPSYPMPPSQLSPQRGPLPLPHPSSHSPTKTMHPPYPRPRPSSFLPPPHSIPAPSAPPASPSPPPQPAKLVRRSSSMAALPLGLAKRPSSRMLRVGGKGLNGMAAMSEVLEEDEILCFTEGGQPLRNVVLPAELMSHFVALSLDNTERGIETCGLLMGTLSHNTFTITNLLVPKQDGTPDTCTTTHEEEQFAYQDERELMTLGWIHTHPTQTCFMSSLDLHTHASYQVMLAEAIAIVCAPRHNPGYGIFRLTDPPGLETIVTCQLPGLFHPHPDLPIYTDTDHGHVQVRAKARFESADLRRKR